MSSQELPTGPEILERLQEHMLDWQGQQRLISLLDQNGSDYECECEDATEMAVGIVNDLSTCFDFDEEQIDQSVRRLDVRGLLPKEEGEDDEESGSD